MYTQAVRKRIEEIDLLVEVGDSVALLSPGYRPFLTDPPIAAVYKPDQTATQPDTSAGAMSGEAEFDTAKRAAPEGRDG